MNKISHQKVGKNIQTAAYTLSVVLCGKLNLKLVNNLAIMNNFTSTKLFTIAMFDYILTIFFAFAFNHITHSDAGTGGGPDQIGLTYENIFIRSTLSEDNQSMVHTTNKTSSNPCLGSTKDTKMFWILYSSNFHCEWQSLLHFRFRYQFTE